MKRQTTRCISRVLLVIYLTHYLVGTENEDESMDQEEAHQNEAANLAALWGKLRHWAG